MPSAPTRQSSPKAGATLLAGAIQPADYPAILLAEAARLNRAGLTTGSENGVRSDVPSDARPAELLDNGDDTVRQVGIKIWVDGSPWIGNIDLSFPYLDSDATRTIGVVPGSCGHANYTSEQLTEIVEAYFPLGWQMACHVQGDKGVDTILDVYEEAPAISA